MMTKREVSDWLETLPDDTSIGIDEGGLILQSLPTPDGTADYLELGGLPESEEEPLDGCLRCGQVVKDAEFMRFAEGVAHMCCPVPA